jgi:hypothetical protein
MKVGMFGITLTAESSMQSGREQSSAGCLNMGTAKVISTTPGVVNTLRLT